MGRLELFLDFVLSHVKFALVVLQDIQGGIVAAKEDSVPNICIVVSGL